MIWQICKWCGIQFKTRADRPQKYCSRACYDTARHRVYKVVCEYCGRTFGTSKCKVHTAKYCSRRCTNMARRCPVSRTCPQCEGKFETTQGQLSAGYGIYCSRQCYHDSRRKTIVVACEQCGRAFEASPLKQSRGRDRFCSRPCVADYMRTGPGPYPPEWTTEFREAIRERDGHTCQVCGEPGNHVHHIDYDKTNCSLDNLITLCRVCHGRTNFDHGHWYNVLSQYMEVENVRKT